MYEAKQCKEKVSRRIDSGRKVRQKAKMMNLENVVLQRIVHLKQSIYEYSEVDYGQISNCLKTYQHNLNEEKSRIVNLWVLAHCLPREVKMHESE